MNVKDVALTDAEARELLSLESGSRPRIYGIDPATGQIVKLASLYYLDKYAPTTMWLSGTTVADLVSRAVSS